MARVRRAWREGGLLTTGATVATLRYDGLGRRVSETVERSGDLDGTRHFVYDGWRIAEVRDGGGAVLRQKVWGTQYVDELLFVMHGEGGGAAGSLKALSALWALHDAQFNVLGTVDRRGKLLERYEYLPYGERQAYREGVKTTVIGDFNGDGVLSGLDTPGFNTALAGPDDWAKNNPFRPHPDILGDFSGDGVMSGLDIPGYKSALADPQTGPPPAVASGETSIGHQGLRHDAAYGLIYNRARMLHPRLERFMQPDPLGYVDGGNLFEYVGNNPINYGDASGLMINLPIVMRMLLQPYIAIHLRDSHMRAEVLADWFNKRNPILTPMDAREAARYYANAPLEMKMMMDNILDTEMTNRHLEIRHGKFLDHIRTNDIMKREMKYEKNRGDGCITRLECVAMCVHKLHDELFELIVASGLGGSTISALRYKTYGEKTIVAFGQTKSATSYGNVIFNALKNKPYLRLLGDWARTSPTSVRSAAKGIMKGGIWGMAAAELAMITYCTGKCSTEDGIKEVYGYAASGIIER